MQLKCTFSYRVLLRSVSPIRMFTKWQIKCATSNTVWQYNSYMWKTVIQVVLFKTGDWPMIIKRKVNTINIFVS